MTAVLKGGKELQAKFARLSRETRGRTLERAATAGAKIIEADAQARAPRRSGRLAAGIEVETHLTLPTASTINIGWLRDVFYGMFQELGTKFHAARPHLRPAFDAKQREARAEVGRVLRAVIDRIAR